jgi:hypothetical protein
VSLVLKCIILSMCSVTVYSLHCNRYIIQCDMHMREWCADILSVAVGPCNLGALSSNCIQLTHVYAIYEIVCGDVSHSYVSRM